MQTGRMTKSEAKAIYQRSSTAHLTLQALFDALVPLEIRTDAQARSEFWTEHFKPFADAITEIHEMAAAELGEF